MEHLLSVHALSHWKTTLQYNCLHSLTVCITRMIPEFVVWIQHLSLCPTHNKVVGGILVSLRLSVRRSVRPSICPTSRVRSVAPTVLVESISYLHILSSNFQKVCRILKFQNLNFWQFFKICNFDLVFFWLGIWCESLVWVIMGRWGVSHNAGVLVIPSASTNLKGGYTGFTFSVCPSVDRIVSTLYLQQYSSDPFHICTSYQATSEGVSCVMFVAKFKNLKFWKIL